MVRKTNHSGVRRKPAPAVNTGTGRAKWRLSLQQEPDQGWKIPLRLIRPLKQTPRPALI
jgi:hypothetical protein